MARTPKNATVIILDVLRPPGDNPDDSFYLNAKRCVDRILHRKIFAVPNDEVAVLLMGTAATDNALHARADDDDATAAAAAGGFLHICEAFDLQCTHWHMLETLDAHQTHQRGHRPADWLAAIVVALDLLGRHSAKKIASHKIVLLTAFEQRCDAAPFASVAGELQAKGIDLMVITDHLQPNPDTGDLQFRVSSAASAAEAHSKSTITELLAETDGIICDFAEALSQLIHYEKRQQRSVPWHCTLDFGTQLRCPISAYIRVRESPAEPWKCDYRTRYKYYANNRELSADESVALVKGYMYGGEPQPHGENMHDYRAQTVKCLSAIGFVERAQFADQHFTGTGSWAVVAQETDGRRAECMFGALVRAMRCGGLALVARYVYRNGCAPKLMVLFADYELPVAGGDARGKEQPASYRSEMSLTMLELVYNNCISIVYVPPLTGKRHAPTAEQCAAVDALIDAMDLMHAVDPEDGADEPATEAFPFDRLLDPMLQHTYRVLAHRALHPTEAIPAVDAALIAGLAVPEKLVAAAAQPLQRVRDMFPLQPMVECTDATRVRKVGRLMEDLRLAYEDAGAGRRAASDAATEADGVGGGRQRPAAAALTCVGSVTPAEDFAELLLGGERFSVLGDQLGEVVRDLIRLAVGPVPAVKIGRAMLIFREEAKLMAPHRYNEFVASLRALLVERGRAELWQQLVVAERMGLITAAESERSAVEAEEAAEFLRWPQKQQQQQAAEGITMSSGVDAGRGAATAASGDAQLDDLLDLM